MTIIQVGISDHIAVLNGKAIVSCSDLDMQSESMGDKDTLRFYPVLDSTGTLPVVLIACGPATVIEHNTWAVECDGLAKEVIESTDPDKRSVIHHERSATIYCLSTPYMWTYFTGVRRAGAMTEKINSNPPPTDDWLGEDWSHWMSWWDEECKTYCSRFTKQAADWISFK